MSNSLVSPEGGHLASFASVYGICWTGRCITWCFRGLGSYDSALMLLLVEEQLLRAQPAELATCFRRSLLSVALAGTLYFRSSGAHATGLIATQFEINIPICHWHTW